MLEAQSSHYEPNALAASPKRGHPPTADGVRGDLCDTATRSARGSMYAAAPPSMPRQRQPLPGDGRASRRAAGMFVAATAVVGLNVGKPREAATNCMPSWRGGGKAGGENLACELWNMNVAVDPYELRGTHSVSTS